jgi:broad specificity phosphatase PhoE
MSEIVASHKGDDTVAVVAHGGTLSAYLAGLLELDFRKRQPWVFDNASLSAVVLGGVRPRIALLNDTCHLRSAASVAERKQPSACGKSAKPVKQIMHEAANHSQGR